MPGKTVGLLTVIFPARYGSFRGIAMPRYLICLVMVKDNRSTLPPQSKASKTTTFNLLADCGTMVMKNPPEQLDFQVKNCNGAPSFVNAVVSNFPFIPLLELRNVPLGKGKVPNAVDALADFMFMEKKLYAPSPTKSPVTASLATTLSFKACNDDAFSDEGIPEIWALSPSPEERVMLKNCWPASPSQSRADNTLTSSLLLLLV